jgi:hypothetical protein
MSSIWICFDKRSLRLNICFSSAGVIIQFSGFGPSPRHNGCGRAGGCQVSGVSKQMTECGI